MLEEEVLARNIGSITRLPLVIDFRRDWHRFISNWEEVGGKVVDLDDEGIGSPVTGLNKGLKIDVGAGETKYLVLPFADLAEHYATVSLWAYAKGTVTATLKGGFVGANSNPVLNVQNEWTLLATRADNRYPTVLIIDGGSDGGSIYITGIVYNYRSGDSYVSSAPNVSLDGVTTYTYEIWLPVYKSKRFRGRLTFFMAGDGVNACNVDIYVRTNVGNVLVGSVSRISSSIAPVFFQVPPLRLDEHYLGSDPAISILLEVSGYGIFKRYALFTANYEDDFYKLNGRKTASASNVSTTVTRYTLIDNNGRGNRYKQASVSLSSPAGGTAKLYINGVEVADYSGTSGTFNVPEDIDIWKIEVDLAGDGVTAAEASFDGIELLGPYIVRR